MIRDPDQPTRAPVVLGPDAVRPVGFGPSETMLPYPRRAFGGYTLLQELFVFPQKFLFFDVAGVAARSRALGAGPSRGTSFHHRAVRARRTDGRCWSSGCRRGAFGWAARRW